MAEVSLEWVLGLLNINPPDTGLSVPLGYQDAQGPQIAACLGLLGARPPVG